MTDVFISYSRKDTDFVRRLFDSLKARGREAWVDWQGLDSGSEWWKSICAAVEDADNFILILSPDALNSIYCHREIEHARKHNKRIIPFIYRPLDEGVLIGGWYTHPEMRPQETLARANWEAIKAIQWIDYPGKLNDDYDHALNALLATVETDPERVQLHTRLLLRIRDWEARGRSPSALLRGDELSAYQAWLSQTESAKDEPHATDEQRTYIAESRRVEDAEQQQDKTRELRIRQFRFTAVTMGVVGVASVLGVILAVFFALREVASQRNALESLRLTVQVNSILNDNGNSEVAALLAIRALKIGYSPDADAALVKASNHLFTRQIFNTQTDEITRVRFSPDGHYILSSANNEILLWDAQTGQQIREIQDESSSSLFDALFSPDGRYILTLSYARAKLWDAQTGRQISDFKYQPDYLRSMFFSPDGRYLLASGSNGVQLLNAQTGQVIHTLIDQPYDYYGLAFSLDSRYVLSGSNTYIGSRTTGEMVLWDVQTGNQIRTLGDQSTSVYSAFFFSDGRSLLTWNQSGVSVWDLQTGQLLSSLPSGSNISAVALSPDNRFIVTGNDIGVAQLWDAQTSQIMGTFTGHVGSIYSVAFSPDGRYIITGGKDKTIRLWDTQQPTHLPILQTNQTLWDAFALSPDGQTLLTDGGYDGSVYAWDTESPGSGYYLLPGNSQNRIASVSYSADGRLVLATEVHGVSYILNAQTGEVIKKLGDDDTNFFIDLSAISPDGNTILTAGDGKLQLWDVQTGAVLHQLEGHQGIVRTAIFSPDGRYALTGSDDATARLWNVQTGEQIRVFSGHTSGISSLAFSPDGHTILTGSHDTTARLWDTETGEQIRIFSGHIYDITSVAFSPDGKLIGTASWDHTARLWNAQTGEIIRTLSGHSSAVSEVAFTPDGQRVITTGWDGTVRYWEISYHELLESACTHVFRDLGPQERQQYSIADDAPTCPQFASNTIPVVPTAVATWTPFITLTPSLTPTITPTPSPTWTPVPAGKDAQLGSNRGKIEPGGGQIWNFEGQAGQNLLISVNADLPRASDQVTNPDGIDTYIVLYALDGSILIDNDDRSSNPHYTDSQIQLTLPSNGLYRIEVRELLNEAGGGYDLDIERAVPSTPVPTH